MTEFQKRSNSLNKGSGLHGMRPYKDLSRGDLGHIPVQIGLCHLSSVGLQCLPSRDLQRWGMTKTCALRREINPASCALTVPITIGNVAYNQGHNSQLNGHPHVPVSSAETNMLLQFPTPHPFNMNPQVPLSVAPSDVFLQFPISDPIASRDITLKQNVTLPLSTSWQSRTCK